VEKNGELRRQSTRNKKPRAVFESLRPTIFTSCAAAEQCAEQSGTMEPYASPDHVVGSLVRCKGVLEPLLSIFLQPFATMLIAFYFAFRPHWLSLHSS
jgi:hypothetical protein